MRKINGDFSDGKAPGLDNLLYSADAEFSCFAVSIYTTTSNLTTIHPHLPSLTSSTYLTYLPTGLGLDQSR